MPMKQQYVFYFLKSWQKLILFTFVLFIIQIIRMLFLHPVNGVLIALVFTLFLILILSSYLGNKKIIATQEGLYIEKKYFGFKNEFYSWDKIVLLENERLLAVEKNNKKTIYLIPFFWGNKNNHNIINIIYYYKYNRT